MCTAKMKTLRNMLMLMCTLQILAVNAQFTNWNWTFGDSCGIKFNAAGIDSFYQTSVNARGTCVSISDSVGQLLFYASSAHYLSYISATTNQFGVVNKRDHQLMQNGLSIKTSLWYHEMVLVPDPGVSNQFYLFTAGVTSTTNPGLRYSLIDLNQNNGLGAVTQKNVMLDPHPINDGLLAIRHGNGRDWWIIHKRREFLSDTMFSYLVTPTGIIGQVPQKIGSLVESGFYRFAINPQGNLIAGVSMYGKLELFDFDRCTGQLSNHRYIRDAPLPTADERDYFWSGEFSANGRYLYVGTANATAYLFQFDVLDSNIFGSRVTLDSIDVPLYPGGELRRGPDNRIYRAIAWNNGVQFNYPYPDSAWNVYNTHLSVINHPDSAGPACDYQPFSVYLPNCRTYLGLPNNPDYTLGALVGSPCDTLTVGLSEEEQEQAEIIVSPNPFTKQFSVKAAKGNFSEDPVYNIFSVDGRLVQQGIFLKNGSPLIDAGYLAAGVYVMHLQVGRKKYTVKLVKVE